MIMIEEVLTYHPTAGHEAGPSVFAEIFAIIPQDIDRSAIQRRAAQFSRERFRREFKSRVK